MPIPQRMDEPGSWHHVMNRGVAHRTVFESGVDVRRFQALLAQTVRDLRIEVHAFVFLATHFHLLIRSVRGELSSTMRWVEREYVRWFNRSRGRDGPLVRGRFRSRRVNDGEDLRNVVHYIDHNPVEARIVNDGAVYPFGSAWHYAHRSGPPWLTREMVERVVCDACCVSQYDPRLYDGVFGKHLTERIQWLLERRLLCSSRQDIVTMDLVNQAPAAVREWMVRQARLADGTPPGTLITSPTALQSALATVAAEHSDWTVQLGYRKPALPILTVGLLRTACGLRFQEIAVRLNMSKATVFKFAGYHARLMKHDMEYGLVAAVCVRRATGAEDQR